MELYAYMTPGDRELAVVEAVVNNRLSHIDYEFEQMLMEHQMNLSLIEQKVMFENGTEDDLVALYEAEASEANAKSKGLLGRIASVIRGLINRIKKFLFGESENSVSADKIPENVVEIELPANPEEEKKKGRTLMDNLKKFIHGGKEKASEHKKGLLTAIATVAGAAVVYKLAKPKVSNFLDDMRDYADQMERDMKGLEADIEKSDLSPEDAAEAKKGLSALQSHFNTVLKMFRVIPQIGTEDFKDSQKKSAEKRAKQEEERQKNKDEDKNDDKGDDSDANSDDKKSKVDKEEEKRRSLQAVEQRNTERIDGINSQLRELNKTIDALEKKKKDGSLGKIHFLKQRRLRRLNELKSKRLRTDAEKEEYDELLHKKDGLELLNQQSDTESIGKLIQELKNACNDLTKKLDKVNNESRKNRDKLNTSTVNNIINGTGDVDDLLQQAKSLISESAFDEFDEMVNDFLIE